MKSPKESGGKSTRQLNTGVQVVFLSLTCPHSKACWEKDALWEEPPSIPLLFQAATSKVVLLSWALESLCCCSSFVLHTAECCSWVGWGFPPTVWTSPHVPAVAWDLSLVWQLIVNHCKEQKTKLDRHRTNCGDTLSHSIPAGASPSTEGFMSR